MHLPISRTRLVPLAMVLALSFSLPVRAQAPAPARTQAVQLSIAAQPLSAALNALAAATGTPIGFSPALVAGKTARAVQGRFVPLQAADRLLEGSGLVAIQEGGAIVVKAAPSQEGSRLAPVTVTGSRDRPGELPAPYAGGQLARGGRVGLLGNKDFMETPFSTTSYTRSFIENTQAQDIGQVIGLTDPSVYTGGSPGLVADSFSLRGFSVATGDVAFGGLYGLIPYYRVTPELAERIEVLKGPSALLGGMPPGGSVGGSINLVPKRAGELPLTRITASLASDAQLGVHADVGQRFGEDRQLGIRFNGVYRNGDTAVDGQSKRARLAALGLDWRSDRVRLSADLYASDDHVQGLSRGIAVAPGQAVPRPPKPGSALGPDWTFSTAQDHAVVLRGEVDLTPALTAHASFGRSRTDFDALAISYTPLDSLGNYRHNFAQQRAIYDKDSAEAGTRARFRAGTVGHELALTASYYHHDYQFGFLRNLLPTDWVTNIYNPVWGPSVDTSFSNTAIPRTGAVRMRSFGVADTLSFAQDQVQLTLGVRRQNLVSDTFNGATGARTTRYDAGATTPAVALLVKASDALAVYGNYIEGLSQGGTAPATAANAGEVFPPFKTQQREIGLKFDLGAMAGTLSLFQIERPSAYTDPVTNVYSFGGAQRNRGVEFSAFGEAVRGVRLLGGVAYTQARLVKTTGGLNQGKSATATPAWQAKLGGEWDLSQVAGLTLTGNAVAMSKQYVSADNQLWVPGRTVVDLGARYALRVANRPVTLRANIQNLGNKAYWTGVLSSGVGAPRTLQLSTTVDF